MVIAFVNEPPEGMYVSEKLLTGAQTEGEGK